MLLRQNEDIGVTGRRRTGARGQSMGQNLSFGAMFFLLPFSPSLQKLTSKTDPTLTLTSIGLLRDSTFHAPALKDHGQVKGKIDQNEPNKEGNSSS